MADRPFRAARPRAGQAGSNGFLAMAYPQCMVAGSTRPLCTARSMRAAETLKPTSNIARLGADPAPALRARHCSVRASTS